MSALLPHRHHSSPLQLFRLRACEIRAAAHMRPPRVVVADGLPHMQTAAEPLKSGTTDNALKSTWEHRAWVASGCASVLLSLTKSAVGVASSGAWAEPLLMAFLGYTAADLLSGVFHWAVDNYGDASTPLLGPQIDAFQGHHRRPRTIARRQFANNLHALARGVAFVGTPLGLATDDVAALAFVGTCAGCVMFSQQFHAWAHGSRSSLPPVVVALQDVGLLISCASHGAHHRPPYNSNYCIVSGMWNGFMDEHKVFEAVEMAIFLNYGLRPRSWEEPSPNWAEEVDSTSL